MSPTNPPLPLKESTLFPKLPPELRLKIWKLDVESLEGQIVEFIWDESEDRITAQAIDVALLKVNRESRIEAQKYFKDLELPDSPTLPLNLRPDVDIFSFHHGSATDMSAASEKK
jgi:hypothetical protein